MKHPCRFLTITRPVMDGPSILSIFSEDQKKTEVHGNRTDAQNSVKSANIDQGGAECGARYAQLAEFPPDLRAIIDAWPGLSEATQTAILAVVHASAKQYSFNGGKRMGLFTSPDKNAANPHPEPWMPDLFAFCEQLPLKVRVLRTVIELQISEGTSTGLSFVYYSQVTRCSFSR